MDSIKRFFRKVFSFLKSPYDKSKYFYRQKKEKEKEKAYLGER